MDNNMESAELIDNTSQNQFEINVNGATAFVEYVIRDNKIYLTHTEVPVALQGEGVGKTLVKKTLQQIKDNNQVLVPSCSFVAAYINDNPEWHSLLSEGYQM
jgi:hypothetical protein